MRIGLFGGTFNPIHLGHMVLAQECWYHLALDKVFFIPSCVPPHKKVEGDVTVADRLNMVRLAIEGDNRFEVSTYEIDSAGTSYSINTIKHFREEYKGKAEFFFLSGADSVENLSMWKHPQEILRLSTFIVATRPGWQETGVYEGMVQRIDIPSIEVSSSNIRERIRSRQPIDYLVPSRVAEYIRDKGLYRD